MNDLIVPLILSGGVGMRLWPISRASSPKQVINLGNGKNMLQSTLLRLDDISNIDNPIVICNDECKFTVAEQLQLMDKGRYPIIIEPVARDTAPALTTAMMMLVELEKQDRICLVMPADHYIGNITNFDKVLCEGIEYAKEGYFVTFGIVPTYPETGYGYIKKGERLIRKNNKRINQNTSAVFIEQFVEKPNNETAKAYLNSGNYCWNSGIFMFRSDRILEELSYFTPDIVKACKLSITEGVYKSGFFLFRRKSFY